jgi:hypothetical protein
VWEPPELQTMVNEEQEKRLALAEARERAEMVDGEVPPEHHELIHRLEADWKHALERLHKARGTSET